jgi:hypothetical protein
MTVRTITHFLVALIFAAHAHTLFAYENTRNLVEPAATNSQALTPTNTCEPVQNIQAEFLPGGKALIYWDEVPGIDKYYVTVVDANQNSIFDGTVITNSVKVSGLTIGQSYTVTVCYTCNSNNEIVCSALIVDYIIIEDLIVMMTGAPCNCNNTPTGAGGCPTSGSDLYSLAQPRTYHILLADGTEQTFVVQGGRVNPVGSCPSTALTLTPVAHGAFNSMLPCYNFGASKIHFHGSHFCISGASILDISYCDIMDSGEGKERSVDEHAAETAYPNPFSDWLHIDFPSTNTGETRATVQVFDATSRLVMEQVVEDLPLSESSITLHTAALKSGCYWVLAHRDGVWSPARRLVKVD